MCKWTGCEQKVWAKGYCHSHYNTARSAGLVEFSVCSEQGCEKPVHGHGLCQNHYMRARRKKTIPHKDCVIEGCKRAAESNGVCVAHHFRIAKFGDPNFRKRVGNGEQTLERMRATRKKCQENYRATPHGKLRQSVKSAKRRLRDGSRFCSLTREQSAILWAQTHCSICGHQMTDDDKSLDHKIPLARGGSNDFDNLQMAHLICNQRKNARIAA